MPEAWQGSGPAVTLPAAPAPPGSMNTRFFLVNYLTTYVALLYLLVLVWAGRGRGTSFERAWQTASRLTATQIVLIALLDEGFEGPAILAAWRWIVPFWQASVPP